MNSPQSTLLADIGIGIAAGLAATVATKYAQQALYGPMPQSVKGQEERVRPGEPPQIAAEKTARMLGHELDDRQRKMLGMVFKFGLGATWGPVYSLLRRHSRMDPLGAGFVTGAAMSLVVDEALTPAMGWSAPSRDYPTITHVRGFLNHMVFGAVAALAAEALYRLTETTPGDEEVPESLATPVFAPRSGAEAQAAMAG